MRPGIEATGQFVEAFERLYKSRRMTQEALARAASLGRNDISRIKNHGGLGKARALRIAEALDVVRPLTDSELAVLGLARSTNGTENYVWTLEARPRAPRPKPLPPAKVVETFQAVDHRIDELEQRLDERLDALHTRLSLLESARSSEANP